MNPKKNETMAVYVRTATSNDDSIITQLNAGLAKALEFGLEPVIYDESVKSGKLEYDQKPALINLLYDISHGLIKHLYVYDLIRLSRDSQQWVDIVTMLNNFNVLLYTNGKTYDFNNPVDELAIGIQSPIIH
jgi:DNA invertase Pin-like site-specific DNA recombinase